MRCYAVRKDNKYLKSIYGFEYTKVVSLAGVWRDYPCPAYCPAKMRTLSLHNLKNVRDYTPSRSFK